MRPDSFTATGLHTLYYIHPDRGLVWLNSGIESSVSDMLRPNRDYFKEFPSATIYVLIDPERGVVKQFRVERSPRLVEL